MKVFLPWLGDYIKGELPDENHLAERLTFAGLEVEATERYGAGLDGIVVGRVESSKRHPAASRLFVCEVFDGKTRRTVVSGAPNTRRGMRVPFAPPGVALPGGLEVAEREVRGVLSSGMLLSASELGLWDDHSGLLELGLSAEVGAPISTVITGGTVLEIGATPNRPDALSHVGIAREVATTTGKKLRLPRVRLKEDDVPATTAATVEIESPQRCSRYVARVIEGVRVKPSPPWLCARLAAAGVRPINNIVDVTNYVLLELGHPLHAFDLDILDRSTIVVRMAQKNETIQTLDGVSRRLDPDDLVIADAAAPVAIAGVMGGEGSEVTQDTRRILLESAWFEPRGVRRVARRHGLHTESSHRFERGADPMIPLFAANRAASLIAKLAGGRVLGGPIDVHPRPHAPERVTLRFARTREVLGFSIPRAEQIAILRALGFVVAKRSKDEVLLEVPSFRTEMSREIDLIEEVARIHGYDAIPATLPGRSPELSVPGEGLENADVILRAREAAAAAGCREVVNYSFLSEAEAGSVAGGGQAPEARPLRIENPLSAEQGAMRTTVLVSLLANLRHNRRFQRGDLKLYEVGRVYLLGESGEIEEPERFAALLAGRRRPIGWTNEDEPVDFYDAKGLVEAVLERLGIDAGAVSFVTGAEALPWLHPRSACKVLSREQGLLGWLGEIHPRLASHFDLPRGVFAVELHVAALASQAVLEPRYLPVPRFPAVLRDLAVVVDEEVPAARVRRLLEEPLPEARDLKVRVVDTTLFDVYSGPQVGAGRSSLAFAIQYQADDRTLTDAETVAIHTALVKRLERDLGAKLRA